MNFLSRSLKTGLPALIARLALAFAIPAHAVVAQAESARDTAALQTAVFAGGCFWGVDAVFKHVKGVTLVESGYAGGSADKANYAEVSGGQTGHAEAVRVRFDPAQVSSAEESMIKMFF